MLSALYFPHVTMSKDLFKNALFLWDEIEYILPSKRFKPKYSDPELGEAVNSFAKIYVPNAKQKQEANDAIVDILQGPTPDWFFVDNVPSNSHYSLHPEKFSPDIWKELKSAGLVKKINEERYDTAIAFGMSLMAILANCCAGTQKRLITDENKHYSALDRYLATIGGAELGNFDGESECLITISLKIMNFKDVSLSRLIEIREKEKSASGAHIRNLRHNYLNRIEEYSEKLKELTNETDIIEVKRIFEQSMRDDLESLKDELKDEAKKVVFSGEMLSAAVAIPSIIPLPVIGAAAATALGGALYKRKVEYRNARNKTLEGHPMAWLYSMNKIQLF